jgi:hypothetical protein
MKVGILRQHIHLLAMEHADHPIKGNVLTLGQQAVYTTFDGARDLIKSLNIAPTVLPKAFDTKNKIPSWNETYMKRFTNAQTVLTLLGAEKVSVADCSGYENPDYLIDLNNDIGKELEEQFDVIVDVGTLEHVFDISTALFNLAKMLKIGGQIILILPASGCIDHGFYSFSPTLLFDFFSNNGFHNFSCYLLEGSQFSVMKKARVYKYDHVGDQHVLVSSKGVEVAFFATKTSAVSNSAKLVKPMQSLFLNNIWKKSDVNNVSKKHKKNFFKKIGAAVTFFTKRYRPEFINIHRHNKNRKNLTFIGKF